MPTLVYLEKSYDCATAIKGDDYIRLLDGSGCLIASFDGISDFAAFTLQNGSYVSPTPVQDCYLAVVRDDGTLAKGGHKCSDIPTTAADIGAAPAEVILIRATDDTPLETVLSNALATLEPYSAAFVGVTDPNFSTRQMYGLLMKHSNNNYGVLVVYNHHDGTNGVSTMSRRLDSGVWSPWDWENPPMQLGIEYRTTERYMGKPVYVKLVYCGALPNATSKLVQYGGNECRPIGLMYGYSDSNYRSYHLGTNTDGTVIRFSHYNISIETTTDVSNTSVYVAVKYFKTTD